MPYTNINIDDILSRPDLNPKLDKLETYIGKAIMISKVKKTTSSIHENDKPSYELTFTDPYDEKQTKHTTRTSAKYLVMMLSEVLKMYPELENDNSTKCFSVFVNADKIHNRYVNYSFLSFSDAEQKFPDEVSKVIKEVKKYVSK